ncbi:MAG: hypothetical protein K6A90_15180 [Lachnospiraceae bacterium]|nr:hypothetical protein [Lachnospiraceae bacterium]
MVNCVFNTVLEHDIDILLLHLFSEDAKFVRLFLNKAYTDIENAEVLDVEISKTDSSLGETDVTVKVNIDGKVCALLIENKIDAIAMPSQPERYVKRAEKGQKNKEYDEYAVFIVCPEKYRENNEAARKYPNVVYYEEIRDYLGEKNDGNAGVLYQQISQAIDKAKKPSQVIINEAANSFFRNYKEYQENKYPVLDLRTKNESNGYWAQYATKLENTILYHKIPNGYVDLTFRNAASSINSLDQIAGWLRDHSINGVSSVVTNKSAVLRIPVPKLNMYIPFEENDIGQIDRCFEALVELNDIAAILALSRIIM